MSETYVCIECGALMIWVGDCLHCTECDYIWIPNLIFFDEF